MKTFSIASLFLLFFFQNQKAGTDLLGKWRLIKVETENEVFFPRIDFYLTIKEDVLFYNLDVNDCSGKPVITENTIDLIQGPVQGFVATGALIQ